MKYKKKTNLENAKLFGHSLDQDDFNTMASLLSEACRYQIGKEELKGPIEIAGSYEQNMIDGRKKLDKLEWGQSTVEKITEKEFYINFTDYLTHKGLSHTHRCTQKICFDDQGLIFQITHLKNEKEKNKLNAFYKKVGLRWAKK